LEEIKKPELLSPAGDFEKLKFAINYGADAVYLGLKNFSLRSQAKNFDDINNAINYAHKNNVRVYLALNIFARNKDIDLIKKYFDIIKLADAVIISDLGLFALIKKNISDSNTEIHISTQANTTNYESAKFWYTNGAKRIILARELTLDEIKIIHEKNLNLILEAFVHGAMCVSYSGRCLLSNYFTARDANHGDCAQPCRWKYNLNYSLEEQTRPGNFLNICEDSEGSFILNSKDLCMINFLPELINSGVKSFKIEGRAKSLYYTAVCTKIYREAIDDYFLDKNIYEAKKKYYLDELKKISHREYSTGFYFDSNSNKQIYKNNSYIKTYDFLGIVLDFDEKNSLAVVEQRNKINVGDEIEIFSRGKNFAMKINELYDENNNAIKNAPHAQEIIKIKMPQHVCKMDIIRKKIN
jgi:putative protease